MKQRKHSIPRIALVWCLVTWWSVPIAWMVFAPLFWIVDGDWPAVRSDIAALSWSLAGYRSIER